MIMVWVFGDRDLYRCGLFAPRNATVTTAYCRRVVGFGAISDLEM